jgi:hypothetical protein
MNYSLFIMMLKEIVSMEAKAKLGVALAASPLLSSHSTDLYCVFHLSPLPRYKMTREILFTVGFRSR